MDKLDELRREIDGIDRQLAELFLRRMEVTGQVGTWKRNHGMPVLDSVREKDVLARKTALTGDPARRADLAALFESIMAVSRRQQRRLMREADDGCTRIYTALSTMRQPVIDNPRVLYQGQPGAYAEEAAVRFFGETAPRNRTETWEDIFLALNDKTADYGLVPIENSSTGAISQVYDLLAKYGAYIVGEQIVPVEHCLMAPPGATLDSVRDVYSHEQGLIQCADYLKAHPAWTGHPRLNTAESAQYVAGCSSVNKAAIGSRRAAGLYGLTILADHISISEENYTRFVVVSPQIEDRAGRNKVSALFRLPHRAGSLHEIMTIFAVNGLNLLKLESRPIRGRNWEYLFFLDFTGDLTGPGMDGVLRELTQTADGFRILGNYKASE